MANCALCQSYYQQLTEANPSKVSACPNCVNAFRGVIQESKQAQQIIEAYQARPVPTYYPPPPRYYPPAPRQQPANLNYKTPVVTQPLKPILPIAKPQPPPPKPPEPPREPAFGGKPVSRFSLLDLDD